MRGKVFTPHSSTERASCQDADSMEGRGILLARRCGAACSACGGSRGRNAGCVRHALALRGPPRLPPQRLVFVHEHHGGSVRVAPREDFTRGVLAVVEEVGTGDLSAARCLVATAWRGTDAAFLQRVQAHFAVTCSEHTTL